MGYHEEVLHPSHIAEVLNREILQAKRAPALAQINMPRDFWTKVIEIELLSIIAFERPSGGEEAIASTAKFFVYQGKGDKERVVYLSKEAYQAPLAYLKVGPSAQAKRLFLVRKGRYRGRPLNVRGIQHRMK